MICLVVYNRRMRFLEKGNESVKELKNFTTLCYIEREEQYLMMHRISKKEDANQGKWIGVGGHFLEGESPEECLIREVEEETGVRLTDYRLRGLITFVSDEWGSEYMFLYTANGDAITEETQVMKDCKEGVLKWVPKGHA